MKSFLNSLFVFLITSASVLAQSNAGSAYSLFGIGSINKSGYGFMNSMGSTGIGVRSDHFNNNINPAAINAMKYGTQVFDVGISLGSVNQATSGQSESSGFSNLSHLNLWFKPSKKLAFSIGLNNLSTISYNILGSNTTSPELGRYNINYQGSGGLNDLSITPSLGLTKNLNIGVKVGFLFGTVDRYEYVNVIDSGEDIIVQNKENIKSPIIELGSQYSIPVGESELILGAVYRPTFTSNTSITSMLLSSSSDSLENDSESQFLLPNKAGAGLSFKNKKWTLASDISYEIWEENNFRDDFDYQNVLTTSFGLSYTKDPLSANYMDRVIWSGGTSFNNYYLKINDQSINEMSVTAAMTLPIGFQKGHISLGYEYAQTGTTSSGLILEKNHLFNISVTLRELWFVRRAYD